MSKRKDGRYQAAKRHQGKIIFGYSRISQADAERVLAEKLAELSIPLIAVQTLRDVAVHYWYPRIENKDDATRRRYEAAWREHIGDALGPMRLERITPATVQAFVNELCRKEVSRSGKGKVKAPMQPASVRFVYAVLRQVCEMAELHGLIERSPCNKLITLPDMPEKRDRVLSVEEAGRVLDAAPESIKLPVFFALVLGLRRGEIAGLEWDDLDRVKGILRIRRQIDNKGKVKSLKTSSSRRDLQLPKEFIEFIDRYGNLDAPRICTISTRMITRDFAEFADTIEELDGWTFHDLRHGATGLVLAATGGDMLTAKAVLGHSNLDTTMVYTSDASARTGAAFSGLTNVLTNKMKPNRFIGGE